MFSVPGQKIPTYSKKKKFINLHRPISWHFLCGFLWIGLCPSVRNCQPQKIYLGSEIIHILDIYVCISCVGKSCDPQIGKNMLRKEIRHEVLKLWQYEIKNNTYFNMTLYYIRYFSTKSLTCAGNTMWRTSQGGNYWISSRAFNFLGSSMRLSTAHAEWTSGMIQPLCLTHSHTNLDTLKCSTCQYKLDLSV
jgi:hypothetical protein